LAFFNHDFNCCITTFYTSQKGIARFIGSQNKAHYVTWQMTAEEKQAEKQVFSWLSIIVAKAFPRPTKLSVPVKYLNRFLTGQTK